MNYKIKGKHTTIIGGRQGLDILLKVASNPNIKKIVPGRIEAKGDKSRRGVRVKITRVDERGNIKMILSNGSSSQEIYLITLLSSYEEGVKLAEEIRKVIEIKEG
ncbi:MAG: DUF2103 domain-containing protein [Nitrososphaerales archaeon]